MYANLNASYHLKSRDDYFLTDHGTWTARRELRGLFNFVQAQRKLAEALKFNPSVEIHPET